MKKLLYIMIFVLLFLTACSSEATIEPVEMKGDIYAEINKKLDQGAGEGEYFFKINNLGKDESIKIDLVKYDGLEETKIIEGMPRKINRFYIRMEKDKYTFAEIEDFKSAKIGETSVYESEENFSDKKSNISISRHLEEKTSLSKPVIVFQKDCAKGSTVVHNNYGLDDSKIDLKNQFGYAVIVTKVEDKDGGSK